MNSISEESLVDLIYEAAIVPTQWKPVLHQIASRVDAAGAILLLVSNASSVGAVWSDEIHALCTGWIEGGWQAKTQRAPRMMALNYTGFVTDSDIYRSGELEQDEAFANYLKPAGYGYGAGTGITMPTGEIAVYSIERRLETGPLTREDCLRLDPLRPHLARAALLAGRVGLERARMMANTLESIGIPGAVVRAGGKLLASNPMFDKLVPAAFQDRSDRLHLMDENADRLFETALAGLKHGRTYRLVSSIPVPPGATDHPLIVHLIPVRGAARDLFLEGSTVVMVTAIDRASVPSAEVLQGLFDLSPAEAKVAQGIANALSADSLATSLGVKRETVRTQIKAVLTKTGVRRQTELIRMLAGKAIHPTDDPS